MEMRGGSLDGDVWQGRLMETRGGSLDGDVWWVA